MADDWTRINAREINRRALERLEAKGKGILLLHDIQPATALGLPELLRELKARGYRIVHVVPAAAGPPGHRHHRRSMGGARSRRAASRSRKASQACGRGCCRIASSGGDHAVRRRASRASAQRRRTMPCR